MRIIAFADIHGAYERTEEILRGQPSPDAVVVAGDVTTAGTPEEAERAIRSLERIAHPVLAVTGNMDPRDVEQRLEGGGFSINGSARLLGEVAFFGISGAPLSFLRTPFELPEEEIARIAEKGWEGATSARWKVFVPHAPPRHTRLDRTFFGKHVGSTAVRSFVEARQPDLLICGHIHESRGVERLGKTEMVNVGPAGKGCCAIIDIDPGIQIRLLP